METKLGKWGQVLQFHVIIGKVLLILKYLGLKETNMGVNCGEDYLVRQDGRKLLCSRMRVKEEEKSVAGRGLYVQVTRTKSAKGSKFLKKMMNY